MSWSVIYTIKDRVVLNHLINLYRFTRRTRRWLTNVSLHENHLTYDVDRMITNTIKMFVTLNSNFNDVFRSPHFETVLVTRNGNQYHNLYHTYEVVEMVACIVSNTTLKNILNPFERTALLVAAVCHDLGHNGISNNEWDDVSISKQKSRVSSITSTEEMYDSWTSVVSEDDSLFKCLIEGLEKAKYIDLAMSFAFKHKKNILREKSHTEIARILSVLILSTDLNNHSSYMEKYEQDNLTNLDLMTLVLKLSDISHSMRPFRVHLHWEPSCAYSPNSLPNFRPITARTLKYGNSTYKNQLKSWTVEKTRRRILLSPSNPAVLSFVQRFVRMTCSLR